jgi:hypothetical protein
MLSPFQLPHLLTQGASISSIEQNVIIGDPSFNFDRVLMSQSAQKLLDKKLLEVCEPERVLRITPLGQCVLQELKMLENESASL